MNDFPGLDLGVLDECCWKNEAGAQIDVDGERSRFVVCFVL